VVPRGRGRDVVAATYPEDLPRVVLVVGDAAVAEAAAGHDGLVKAGVAAAAGRLAVGDEGRDGGVAAVLLLDLGVAPSPEKEDGATRNPYDGHHAYHDAGRDAGRVGAGSLAVGGARLGYEDGLAACGVMVSTGATFGSLW